MFLCIGIIWVKEFCPEIVLFSLLVSYADEFHCKNYDNAVMMLVAVLHIHISLKD